jgi:glucose-6-phosphate isomerase
MINFDNSFFFNKSGLNYSKNKSFNKNLELAQKNSEEMLKEFKSGKNQILQSFTAEYQKKIRDLKQDLGLKNKKKAVIGIGGSSSGAKALSFFLKDDISYFDNLDLEYFKNFFLENNLKDYVFFIISKSGDTFETLALLNLLIIESKKIKDFDIFDSMVIITENKDSILKSFSIKKNIKIVEHNPDIGGRFSILSETGMLPFVDLNLNIEDGSEKFINLLNKDSEVSPTKNAAIILTCLSEMKLSIYCNLIYNYRLKHFSYWFHQLHGESLGKSNNIDLP